MKSTDLFARLVAILVTGLVMFNVISCDQTTSVQPNEPVDENFIGEFSGIRVTVADGVDRAHGEHALDRIEMFDTNPAQGFPEGGRVAHVSGGVINEIRIIGAAEGDFAAFFVQHIGNGILEVRLNQTAAGGLVAILTDGRWQIENDVIHAFILDTEARRCQS